MEKCYLIWSPEHIAVTSSAYQHGQYDLEKYKDMLRLEATDGSSWSSHVYTSDIDGLLQAFVNETNHTMQYVEVAEIVAYDRGAYQFIADAERSGGTYHISTIYNPTDDKIRKVVNIANRALEVVGRHDGDVVFVLKTGKDTFRDWKTNEVVK